MMPTQGSASGGRGDAFPRLPEAFGLAAALLLGLAAGLPVGAATVTAVGCLGNSGGAGPGLVRVGDVKAETGVVVDAAGGVWVSGGDRINRLGIDGHLIESHPVQPADARVTGRTFAVQEEALFALGEASPGQPALFSLPMRPGGVAQPLTVVLPPRARTWWPHCLGAQPWHGRLLLACETCESPPEIGLFLADSASGSITPWSTLAGQLPQGLAVDTTRGVIYLGAQVADVRVILALDADGRPLPGVWPVPTTKTPAIPTAFEGRVSLAAGALWDTAHYGFLARLDLAAQGAPGRVLEWHHELDYPTQLADVGPGSDGLLPLLIGTSMADAVYYATWSTAEQQLRFVRRLGCLPVISSLGLTADGWVSVGTYRAQLWWRWDDDRDTPPRKIDMHIATTPGFQRGEEMLAIGAVYRLDDGQNQHPFPMVFTRRAGDRNEARRQEPVTQVARPVGLAVQTVPGKDSAALFVTDAASKRLFRASLWLPNLQVDAGSWQPVTLEGAELRAPTDVVALPDGRLLLGDGGRVLLLEPRAEGFAVTWALDSWGPAPEARFGGAVRLAVEGPRLLVSDQERHRLLWFEWTERRLLVQFGETDRPGDDARHLGSPGQVALSGSRAVVADAGNQRVLRLVLAP
jgi:hypothetical protein